LDEFLLSQGFIRGIADETIYHKITEAGQVIVGVYVDDMLVMGDDQLGVENFKRDISNEFKMKDLGETQMFLGLKVERDREKGVIYLSQGQQIEELLYKFGLGAEDVKEHSLPAAIRTNLSSLERWEGDEKGCRKNIHIKIWLEG
jgi:hypothetical protein